MDAIELQDLDFVAAVREGREPEFPRPRHALLPHVGRAGYATGLSAASVAGRRRRPGFRRGACRAHGPGDRW
ncbi:hypothetical protein ABZ802_05925 [Streptomyces sp. NPDC047737]|uniref:hypothetical protein n=1 Tax=unclassified Streptomyces TaxID=2593676 RepID=UPI0033F10739